MRTPRAEAMGLGAVLHVAPDGTARLEIAVALEATRASRGEAYARPSDARWPGSRGDAGTRRRRRLHRATLGMPMRGRWLVTIETDTWRLSAPTTNGELAEVRLGTARAVD